MERAVERSWADMEVVSSRATAIWVEGFMLHLRGIVRCGEAGVWKRLMGLPTTDVLSANTWCQQLTRIPVRRETDKSPKQGRRSHAYASSSRCARSRRERLLSTCVHPRPKHKNKRAISNGVPPPRP